MISPDNISDKTGVGVYWLLEVPCIGGPRDCWAVSVGVTCDRSSLRLTWRRLGVEDGLKIHQILIKTNEGPNSNAAMLCIPMTTDNESLTILNSAIHPQ